MKQKAIIEPAMSDAAPSQAELGKRFRRERLRLGLTPEDVAHYCGMSVSAVFGWEAGRNRIPLSAGVNLWAHGFDIEKIICGDNQLESIEIRPHKPDEQPSKAMGVPLHLLRRHRLTSNTAFIYHNLADGSDIASSGDLLLMSWLPDDMEVFLETSRVALLQPEHEAEKLLCRVSTSQKGKVKIEIGDTSGTVKLARLLELCAIEGSMCHRLACQSPPPNSSIKPHAQRLAKMLNMV